MTDLYFIGMCVALGFFIDDDAKWWKLPLVCILWPCVLGKALREYLDKEE